MDLGPGIITTLLANSSVTNLLGDYGTTGKAIHTRVPVPEDTNYPLIVAAGDISNIDDDFLNNRRNIITRDIAIYGQAIRDYRNVERLGFIIRDLFHRQADSIPIDGYRVIDIVVIGPRIAPTSDDKYIGRIVNLRVDIQPTETM